jgi:hypothetical protein
VVDPPTTAKKNINPFLWVIPVANPPIRTTINQKNIKIDRK